MASLFRDKQDITIMKRAEKVRSLRLAGFTYRQIADQLDISIDTVRRDMDRITVEFPQQTVRELAAEQNDKLVEMMKPQFLKAAKGDHKAVNAMLKLLDHQAKLFGLYNVEMEGESSQAVEMLVKFFGMIRNDDEDAGDGGADGAE